MLFNLFYMFAKIGFVSFGGGYPMMALILQEGQSMVGLTTGEFADMLALELLASGPVALNAATYVGFIKAGILGAIAATLGALVAPIIITTIIWLFLQKFKENKYVRAFLDTIKLACGGALLTTAIVLGKELIFKLDSVTEILSNPIAAINWISMIICVGALILNIKYKANPIYLVLGCGVIGAFLL